MRKILFLFVAIALLQNCSRDRENETSNPIKKSQFFNPPSWIHGKWGHGNVVLFKFTNDDFLLSSGGVSYISYKGLLQSTRSAGGTAVVDEDISNSHYDFTIKIGNPGGSGPVSEGEYQFRRVSSTKIEWVNNPAGNDDSYYLTKIQ
ncbi:hypothetical protein [Riemerella anatipestifer]|uniref:Uncharacterized protein n=1 Tax=Riemerella anatipestifer TaxID=34085 RepID=A0A1S7DUU5_RIEAN|nr:hypothetical protein [Riemerella anatipestifer]AQY22880.1 hypothetical protein AB406_1939 [Riemerella anatipestifer]MCO4303809.1 hypothetical protein [Riemerella anatipestifer]MCO7351937.1 hypothetical protein [Riemerella anatipestifer]MCT6760777.1 hypothetical protein [Riemerella anatipestifer]MCT6764634.1 hypothetical protein [Riemerella anatipestifer]